MKRNMGGIEEGLKKKGTKNEWKDCSSITTRKRVEEGKYEQREKWKNGRKNAKNKERREE